MSAPISVRVTDAVGAVATAFASASTSSQASIIIGQPAIGLTDDSGNGNLLCANRAMLAQPATVQSLSFYITAPAGKLRLGIYDATGPSGGPGTKIAETSELTPAVGWNTANVIRPVLLAAGNYWLSYLPSSNGLSFVKAGGGSGKFSDFPYGVMPSTFPSNPSLTGSQFSIYATLTPAQPPSFTVSLGSSAMSGAPDGVVSGGGSYPVGSMVTATCAPASGMCFAHWSDAVTGNVLSTSPNYTFAIVKDMNLVANMTWGRAFQQTASFLPADRLATANWQNAGLLSVGGVAGFLSRTVDQTVTPRGSGLDDSANIQSAVNACATNKAVLLNGTAFVCNSHVLVNKPITVRGNGAGVTTVTKTNGAAGRLGTTVSGTNGIKTPQDPGGYSYDVDDIFVCGPSASPGPDESTAVNLTSDGVQGALSVTVADATGFTAGQFVLLDELQGGAFALTPVGFTNNGGAYDPAHRVLAWQGDRAVWNIHLPFQFFQDDAICFAAYGPFREQADFVGGISGSTLTISSTSYGAVVINQSIVNVATGQILGLVTSGSGSTWTLSGAVATPGGTDLCGVNYAQINGSISGNTLTVNSTSAGVVVAGSPSSERQCILDPNGNFLGTVISNAGGSNWTLENGAVACSSQTLTLFPYPSLFGAYFRKARPTNEIKEIASVGGNTITFTSPLTIGYRTSHIAQLTRYTQFGSPSGADSRHIKNIGIENMTLVGGADGTVAFLNAAYSWIYNCEISQWLNDAIDVNGSFRIHIEGCYNHTGSWPQPGGAGYAISVGHGSAEMLMTNSITLDTCKNIVMRGAGAGSVVSFNYFDNAWDQDNPFWQEVSANASHLVGCHHILFEGNVAFNFDSDYTHGNSIYLTCFRNWFTGQRRDFTSTVAGGGQNIRCFGLASYGWYCSAVGNVLGYPSRPSWIWSTGSYADMSTWNLTTGSMACDVNGGNCVGGVQNSWGSPKIWAIGYDPERFNQAPEPITLSSLIRDGNWDWQSSAQHWYNTPATFAIPNSMYLPGKPTFFGAATWPIVNPASGAATTNPALARFNAGTPNVL